jgi:hypothetical protein
MGADLYIESQWAPQSERVISEAGDGPDAINKFYQAARATGAYFHNSYNVYDVMFAMGLSWWKTAIPMLEDNGLPIHRARELVDMIEARPLNKQTFSRHYFEVATGTTNPIIAPLIHNLPAETDKPSQPPVPSFEELLSVLQRRRDELLAILRKSIELNEPVVCSL